jgi:hypothetical protein
MISRFFRPCPAGAAALRGGRSLAFVFWLALAAGCVTSPFDPARAGPFFNPTNHVGADSLPAGLHRVVLLPVAAAGVTTPEMAAAFDPVFTEALQRENRFEVVALSREMCRKYFGAEEFSSAAALPHDFMAVVRREFAADAVMFVDFTVCQPYRPLSLGVRAKLATVEGTQLLWSFDAVFSAADPAVANSARRFFLKTDRSDVPADLSPAALQSPSRFGAYVAGATFATLPPVYAPPPPPQPPVSKKKGLGSALKFF